MYFQFDMTPVVFSSPPPPPSPPPDEATDLLRRMVEIQQEQLAHLRFLVAAQDAGARWRAFLGRWRRDFPGLSEGCRQAVPVLEHTYGKQIEELTEYLAQNGPDALDTDFGLQDFLDRFGMRLAQLGTLLNLVASLAEPGPPSESP